MPGTGVYGASDGRGIVRSGAEASRPALAGRRCARPAGAVPCRRRRPARRAVRLGRCGRDRRGHQPGNAADRPRRGTGARRQRADRASVDGPHAGVFRRPFRFRRPAGQHVLRAGPGQGVRGSRPRAGRRRGLHQPAQDADQLASRRAARSTRIRVAGTVLPARPVAKGGGWPASRGGDAGVSTPLGRSDRRSVPSRVRRRRSGGTCHADPQAPVGTFGHRSCYVAPYVRIKARRVRGTQQATLARC